MCSIPGVKPSTFWIQPGTGGSLHSFLHVRRLATRRCALQAIKHDMNKADEADKSPDLHGNEQEEPASTTRTRKKASEAVDKVCCCRLPPLTLHQLLLRSSATNCPRL